MVRVLDAPPPTPPAPRARPARTARRTPQTGPIGPWRATRSAGVFGHPAARRPSPLLPAMRYTYPHTIDNGAGERLTFLRRVRRRRATAWRWRTSSSQAPGPPMHVHHYQEEALTVRQGGSATSGPASRRSSPGRARRSSSRRARRTGSGTPARASSLHGYIEPADNIEYFLAQSSTRSGARRAAAGPVRRGIPDDPLPERVRDGGDPGASRLVFPLLVAVGRLLGKYGATPTPPSRSAAEPPGPRAAGAS